MIKINREKAHGIVYERFRKQREPMLAELDVGFMKALEAGVSTDSITARKQELRDVTVVDLSVYTLEALAVLSINDVISEE